MNTLLYTSTSIMNIKQVLNVHQEVLTILSVHISGTRVHSQISLGSKIFYCCTHVHIQRKRTVLYDTALPFLVMIS